MPTGDGIERVSRLESLLTPAGGEGGSVPQALGSKAEERAKRRKKKKDSYALYLESSTWRKIRAAVLKRDKRTCRVCKARATVVHHVRYPKNLGEEKLEWLYSLCAPCHNEIHRLAEKMTLRKATEWVLEGHREKPKKSKKRKKKSALLPKGTVIHLTGSGPALPAKAAGSRRKKSKIEQENERLRATFKANRERRERRWG